MPAALRAFIALPIPDAVAAFLSRIQGKLQALVSGVRWVPPANIHLTLKFLGDIDPSSVPAVAACMDATTASVFPFTLAAMGGGVFPNFRQARVLWVGLTGDLKTLGTLQAGLDEGLESIGFSRESRSFRAHLTIGRMKRRIDPGILVDSVEALGALGSEPFRVDQLRLYQSLLKPTGAQYSPLHTAHLAEDGTG